jgi:transcriptional regulator with XRE-family HTH domain
MTGADLRRILSKNIKLLRCQRSLSQIELAEKADISIPFLSNIERQNKWPHPDTLTKLAKALDVEVYTLFQDKTPSLPDNVQNTLAKFKKDIAVSLHKTVFTAIDCSLETIGSHYLEENPKGKKR